MHLRPLVAAAVVIAIAGPPIRVQAQRASRSRAPATRPRPSGMGHGSVLPAATPKAPDLAEKASRPPPPASPAGSPVPAVAPPVPDPHVAVPPSLPRLKAVRATDPPVLDGRLDDAAWTLAPATSQFTQQQPYEGAAPSEPTTLRVVYDDDALYIGFDCQQVRTPIVGRLTRRDEDSESDWVWVHIDSRRDGRTAYFFAVNVKGVLGDAIMHGGSAINFEWDENWDARTAITPRGWSAEMRIPLRVLRFTPGLPVQDWGLWASRFVAVSQEKDDWPHIPREVAAPIPFFGRLDDLQQIARGGAIEVRPFALGKVRYRT
ncbi:MAG: carbohydrate binding family 9 domain-containing protein, partial [Deltaproteobacteria bacterium]|nr:carbohydrate binding family 9 domain-containing protein [Deltaproteobacteria bacterium]